MRTLTSERAAEMLREAASLIETRGWTQHDRERINGLTLDSALCEVTHPLAGEDSQSLGRHSLDCEEICDRLLGWMLLTGETHLPNHSRGAGNILAAWNDERGRTEAMAAEALRAAADALEVQSGDPLADKIRECWKQSQRDIQHLRSRHARGGQRMIYDRMTGMALAWMLTQGREPVHLTHVLHDVHEKSRDELGIDLDRICEGT